MLSYWWITCLCHPFVTKLRPIGERDSKMEHKIVNAMSLYIQTIVFPLHSDYGDRVFKWNSQCRPTINMTSVYNIYWIFKIHTFKSMLQYDNFTLITTNETTKRTQFRPKSSVTFYKGRCIWDAQSAITLPDEKVCSVKVYAVEVSVLISAGLQASVPIARGRWK